jgi:tetratricopeptide (TPR) repeat protein
MSASRYLLIVALSIAAGAADTAGTARADVPKVSPEAEQHLESGKAAYAAADYATASREFEAAYEIDPNPSLLYAWAQALRLNGRCADAVPIYRRYLETGPTDQVRIEVDKLIRLCEPVKPVPEPKLDPPLDLPLDPRPDRRPPAEPAHRPERRRWYRDVLGGTLTIGGVAVAGAGVAFLVASKRSEDAANRAELRSDFLELLDEATVRRRVGLVGLGLGAALVTGGIVRYVTRRGEPAGVAISTTGTAIHVRGTF